jgi:hypothetical protein
MNDTTGWAKVAYLSALAMSRAGHFERARLERALTTGQALTLAEWFLLKREQEHQRMIYRPAERLRWWTRARFILADGLARRMQGRSGKTMAQVMQAYLSASQEGVQVRLRLCLKQREPLLWLAATGLAALDRPARGWWPEWWWQRELGRRAWWVEVLSEVWQMVCENLEFDRNCGRHYERARDQHE